MSTTAQITEALVVHREIAVLYERISEQRFHFRAMDESPSVRPAFASRPDTIGVDRDRVICELANKAINTHRAIRVLCESELADDAYSLVRVLMENAVNLAWICGGDWIQRVDTFALATAAAKRRLHEVLLDQLPGSAVARAATTAWEENYGAAAVSKHLFNDEHRKWALFPDPTRAGKLRAVSIGEMLGDLNPSRSGKATGELTYALTFFDCSQFVHSTAFSLRSLDDEMRSEYTYQLRERPRRELAFMALVLSSSWMLFALSALADFIGAQIGTELNALGDRLKGLQFDRATALRVQLGIPE